MSNFWHREWKQIVEAKGLSVRTANALHCTYYFNEGKNFGDSDYINNELTNLDPQETFDYLMDKFSKEKYQKELRGIGEKGFRELLKAESLR